MRERTPGTATVEHTPGELHLLQATERAFAPLALMLARNGLGFWAAMRPLKRAYLRALLEHLSGKNLPATAGRVAIWSGLSKSEVTELLEGLDRPELVGPSKLHAVTALLTGWNTDSRFLLPFVGGPRDLLLAPDVSDPEQPSFQELARTYAPHIPVAVLLEELVRLGNLSFNYELNLVRLNRREYLAGTDDQAQIEYVGLALANLAGTIVRNLHAEPEATRFERSVFSDFPLSSEAADNFNEFLKSSGKRFLEDIDKWFSEQEPASDQGTRVGASLFFFSDESGGFEVSSSRAAPRSSSSAPLKREPELIDVLAPRNTGVEK